ncbi:MAG: hypothetical protein WC554_18065 [Clostridia bacterium]|jgi:hypothetical protein
MDKNGKVALGIGLAALAGLLIYTMGSAGSASGTTHKFNVGDHITGRDLSPTNVVYVVTKVYDTTYTLGQWFQNEIINEVPGYSIAIIDTNYVLAPPEVD